MERRKTKANRNPAIASALAPSRRTSQTMNQKRTTPTKIVNQITSVNLSKLATTKLVNSKTVNSKKVNSKTVNSKTVNSKTVKHSRIVITRV